MGKYILFFLIGMIGFGFSGCATTDARSSLDNAPWHEDVIPMNDQSDWDIIDLGPTMFREGKETAADLQYDVIGIF